MSVPDFSAALSSLGIRCDVEKQGKLAVIMLLPPVPDPSLALRMTIDLFDARTRRAIVALGRTHGFANVCVELRQVDAALSGD
jgi:hypothetical protein